MRRRVLLPLLLVLAPLALVGGGVYLGGHPRLLPEPVRDTLVGDSEAQLFQEAVDEIAEDYYRPVDRRDLVNRSLESAVRSLKDRFSHYFSPATYAEFVQTTSGAFVGVGVSVQASERLKRGLRILKVYDDSPAKRAGLREGDLIAAVDGRKTAGRSTEEVTTQIKGPVGTSVRLTLRRGGDERTVRVERARVALPIVQDRTERADDGSKVAYVSLASFTSGAHGELGEKIRERIDKGARSVVLDLRDNGGGLLNEAVLISSIFLEEGTVVSTRGRSKPRRVYTATGGAIDEKIPVVVLVNENSASASEIVAGALQDRGRARVVGTKTFGKGVFQEVKQLSNGGALDITVGEYFTPKGRNLGGGGVKQGAGIKPDVPAKDDPKTRRDEALDRALDAVTAPAS